jgi:LPXTG-site transpeptidase (sortase) family protein
MTQRKKRDVAYIFACSSLVASLLLWTGIIRGYVAQNLHGSPTFTEQQTVWEGALFSVGEAVHLVAEAIAENIHSAAPSTAATLIVPEEVVGRSDTLSPPQNDNIPSDELSQWEVSQAYSMSIPTLGIRTPILLPSMRFWASRQWNLLEEQMQVGLRHGSVAYPHSAIPGEMGNLIIAGHSSPPTQRAAESAYGSLFERVPELEIGDQIIVTKNGKRMTYSVSDSTVVSPSETEVLRQQDDESVIKLITCFPVGTTKDRMVVTAHLVE